jgi:hypothetical protein
VSVFDDTPAEAAGASRGPMLAVAAIVLLAAGGAYWYLRDSAAETPAPAARSAPPPAAKRTPAAAAPKAAPEAPAAARRPAEPDNEETPAAPAAAAPRADAVTLVVESDVSGASVFVDRQFVGNAPVTLKGLAPGSKRINLSAEGFDGISRTVELAPGEQTVSMRFREVRLNESTAVSHKHGMGGGCEGTLRATVDGLAYDTTNKGDAFSLRYEQVEAFDVNYLEKNLRVKQRGGKTWNFTDRDADNADRLFVFHREVEAARAKLGKGYAAVR